MKKLVLLTLVFIGLIASVTPAEAHGLRWRRHRDRCCYDLCTPCCAPCCEYVEKVITCYRPAWHEKEVECVVNKLVPREVVTKHTCTICNPEWREEKRSCIVNTFVPRDVEREIVVCKWVPSQVTDCCGCCCTVCKPVQEVKKIRCTICECVPVKKEYTARVCHYRQEPKTYECRHIVYDCVPQKVMRKVSYCEMVPYQTTVKVPVPRCIPCCVACCH